MLFFTFLFAAALASEASVQVGATQWVPLLSCALLSKVDIKSYEAWFYRNRRLDAEEGVEEPKAGRSSEVVVQRLSKEIHAVRFERGIDLREAGVPEKR